MDSNEQQMMISTESYMIIVTTTKALLSWGSVQNQHWTVVKFKKKNTALSDNRRS